MKFSIVIPTYNREEDLRKCLDSIFNQTLLPDEVIIIDDGDLPGHFLIKKKDEAIKININLIYYKKNHELERRGLSESKNKALELINNPVFFILDDDVILEKVFCERIIEIWNHNKDESLIGVGGIIINRRKRLALEKIFNVIFGLSSKYEWDVNRVAFQVWNEDINRVTKGYYAHGGACSYKLDIAKELRFSTFSGGRTSLEDVDFCLRAKNKNHHFIIQPEAQLYHYPSVASRENIFQMGFKEAYNRRVIFNSIYKKPSLFLKAWFFWASIGWIFRQVLSGNFQKGKGMIKGGLSLIK